MGRAQTPGQTTPFRKGPFRCSAMTQPLGGAHRRGEQLQPWVQGGLGRVVSWWPGARQPYQLDYCVFCHLVGIFSLSTFFLFKISRFFPNDNFENVNDGLFLLFIYTSFVWYSKHTTLSHIYPTFCAVFLLLSSTTKPPCCSMKTCTLICRLSWATCSWTSTAWLRDRERGYSSYLSL